MLSLDDEHIEKEEKEFHEKFRNAATWQATAAAFRGFFSQ